MAKRRPPSRAKGGSGRARRGGGIGRFLIAFGAGIALFAVGAYFGERLLARGRAIAGKEARSERSAPAAKREPARPKPAVPTAREPRSPEGPTPVPASGETPLARVAIVVDDLGRDPKAVNRLLAYGVPFSYAVLPFEKRSGEVAEMLVARDAELLLHLPMEPKGHANPGPGALVAGMSDREIERATRAAVAAVPGAVGVNNHMGSAVTPERDAMRAMLSVLREDGLFFLDSRTTADSVGYDLARSEGIATARRDLFLDDTDERGAIVRELDSLMEIARSKGAAIGIAHPRAETFAAFDEVLPRLRLEGIEVVPVSFLLERGETLPE